MNLPNKLTVFRMILIVPFVILLLGGHAGWGWFDAAFGGIEAYTDYIALVIFVIASLTDMLDGKIARKYNLVTNFGKFMDPLADKLLVCSAMICLIDSGFRLVASDNHVVIAASYWGKFKTTFQMSMVILMIANIQALNILTQIVMWIALALTIISLIDYIVKNKNVLFDGNI